MAKPKAPLTKKSAKVAAPSTPPPVEEPVIAAPSEIVGDVTEEMWVKARGWTPLEYLTYTYRNPWQESRDRIAAAKAVLDYVHRKLPQKIEIDGNLVQTKKINAENLSKLSDEELTLFTKLLEKLS